jgi:outer membrane protein
VPRLEALMVFSRSLRLGVMALVMCSVPALAHAETMREALTSAYRNSPDLLSAYLDVKLAAEGIVSAKSAKLPTIGATLNTTQAYTPGSPLDLPSISGGVNYSQRLFDNYATEARIESARAGAEAKRYALQSAEQKLFLDVVTAYMAVLTNTQLAQLRQENVTFYQAQVKSAKDRLEIGEGTKIDVSQAEARLAQGTASYQSALASLEVSRATYERLVGHAPKNLSMTYRLGTLLPTSLERAINEAMSAHPAIFAAQAGVRAAQAGADAASASFGPTLDLSAGVNSTFYSPSPAWSGPTPSASVSLSLKVPIYGGGALGAGVRSANISQMKSEVAALSARDQIKEAVISSWSALRNAQAAIDSANTAVASGELALEGVVQSRDVGQSTTLDVLNAQSELTSIREGLIQATQGKVLASFQLVAATGHLTAADLGLAVEIKTGEDYIAKAEDVWQELRALD